MGNIVAIIGRENVGKSTLFNRILGKRVAVVDNSPGTTRDINIKEIEMDGKGFLLVDTGGILREKSGLKAKVTKKAKDFSRDADIILFMVDAKDGVTPSDIEVAEFLRKLDRKVILVVNKVDNEKRESLVYEFLNLGFPQVFSISALHNIGISELLDEILGFINTSIETKERLRIAILGRPNVGKSTYINRLLKEERMIVDELPGTTVDSCDVIVKFSGKELLLIDTPGLKRKSRVKKRIDYYSSLRTLSTILRCDVAIVLIESPLPVMREDKKIVETLIENGKGIVLACNKYDLGVYLLKHTIPFAGYIPVVYISASTGWNLKEPLKKALLIGQERQKVVSTSKLKELKEKIGDLSIKQVGKKPPTFLVRSKVSIKENKRRYIEKKIRELYGFEGVPIRIRC